MPASLLTPSFSRSKTISEIKAQGDTQGVNFNPFFAMFMNGCINGLYGLVTYNGTIILVNWSSVLLCTYYLYTFFSYTRDLQQRVSGARGNFRFLCFLRVSTFSCFRCVLFLFRICVTSSYFSHNTPVLLSLPSQNRIRLMILCGVVFIFALAYHAAYMAGEYAQVQVSTYDNSVREKERGERWRACVCACVRWCLSGSVRMRVCAVR